jgi:hypothetical protein
MKHYRDVRCCPIADVTDVVVKQASHSLLLLLLLLLLSRLPSIT